LRALHTVGLGDAVNEQTWIRDHVLCVHPFDPPGRRRPTVGRFQTILCFLSPS
jgi:hypothetical protein